MADFHDWLIAKLNSLSVDAEAFGEYAEGIMTDADTPLEERCEAASAIIEGSIEDPDAVDTSNLASELGAAWEKHQAAKQSSVLAQAAEQQSLAAKRAADDVEAAKQAAVEAEKKERAKSQLSKEDRKARHQLLNQYGVELEGEDVFDEEGNIRKDQKAGGAAGPVDALATPFVNPNKAMEKAAAVRQREVAKTEAAKQKAAIKTMQAAEKAKKEKKKEKTVKRERRAGRG